MGIITSIKQCIFNKYATFAGRASQGEFLSYVIFYVLFFIAWDFLIIWLISFFGDLNLIDFVLLYIPFALFPPLLSVTARRFHDCGKSAWLLIILLVPFLNLYGLWILCLHRDPRPNSYGNPPVSVSMTL